MIRTFLHQHPMFDLLTGLPQAFFPTYYDRTVWDGLDEADRYDLLELSARCRNQPYPMLYASRYMDFRRIGDHERYEKDYFFRRRKLIAAVMDCCITGTLAQLDQVIDGLWCICEETSWVVPAHNRADALGRPALLPDPERPYIDLFAAQTGMVLSLVGVLLGAVLEEEAPDLLRRVRRKTEERILKPFMAHDDMWWMGIANPKRLNNWTPWIVSNIMLTACCTMTDSVYMARVLERACLILDRWLDGMPSDGGCDEGVSYWNVAGASMMDCFELLERVTDGRMDFRRDEKACRIMRFPFVMDMGGGWFANFADSDARPRLSGERLLTAGEWMQDDAMLCLGAAAFGKPSDEVQDTPHFWRLLQRLFHPHPAERTSSVQRRDAWLEDVQIRTVEEGGFLLCAKGGHNGEQHNHNDVGSFILYVDGEPVIVDAGHLTYTPKTFSDDRYAIWNTRSACHNLPVIGGYEQQAGERFFADEVRRMDFGTSMELKCAYPPESGVRAYRRILSVRFGQLLVSEKIELEEPADITWVFMLRHEPHLDEEGYVVSGPVSIVHDLNRKVEWEEIPVKDCRMARSYPGSLWRVTYTASQVTSLDECFIVIRE